MSQYQWTLAGAMPPTIGEAEEMETEGKEEEDHLPEGMYLHQDTGTPLDALTVERRDTTHVTAPRRNSSPTVRGTTSRLTSLTWKKKENKTMKCKMPKNQTQWHQSVPNWSICPSKTRCAWQRKWEPHRIFPQPN